MQNQYKRNIGLYILNVLVKSKRKSENRSAHNGNRVYGLWYIRRTAISSRSWISDGKTMYRSILYNIIQLYILTKKNVHP